MAWQIVCTSNELVEGNAKEIVYKDGVIAIFRHNGRLYAIDGVCVHQGGPLAKGRLMDGTIVCPWHGWQYELSTGNHAPTCRAMLNTYQIHENDGQIEVDLPT
jgi:nitrite reductase (NADH) small subunit